MSLDLSLNYPDIKFSMGNGGKHSIYEFDGFRLDPEKLMLYRDGSEIAMSPKMVKTLVVLVENRGKILSKDELIDNIWSDSIVDESNLSQHLYHLRKTLGEHPDGRQYIETFRRRGYRFNGHVVVRDQAPDPPANVITHRATSQPSIERSGNVLRLVDRAAAPTRNVTVEPATPSITQKAEPPSYRRAVIITAVLVTLAFSTLAAIFKFRSSAVPQAAVNTEISIMRLTNGSVPMDATISPNGDYFAYHEIVEGGERLWLQQTGNASRVKTGEAPKGTSYGAKTFSPDGKSLYFSLAEQGSGKTALYRMPAIGGPQVKILDDVVHPVSFSPDGSEFVFIRDGKAAGNTSLIIADKEGKSQRTILQRSGPAGLVGSPAWSPDGKVIAFAAMGADNTTGVYVTDSIGATPKQISNERWDNAYRIAWLPDGGGFVMVATRLGDGYTTRRNQVYYVSYPHGVSRRLTTDGSRHQEWSLGVSNDEAIIAIPVNRSSQIWSLAANGASSSAVQITRGVADGRAGLAPLPDGRIGYVSRVGEDLGIWTMNADGSESKQLSTGVLTVVEEVRPDPKGRYLVFSGYKDGYSHLYRYEIEGDKMTQLTFEDDQPVDSTISADGASVVYHSSISGKIIHPPQLFRTSIDGGKPKRLGHVECETPNYSPAGDKLSCIRGEEIVIVSADDGSQLNTYRLLPYARVNFGARWTPDGKGLVYIRSEKGSGNLWVQPIDGSGARPLTDFTYGDVYNFAFSFDGTRLFAARGQQTSDAVLIRNYR